MLVTLPFVLLLLDYWPLDRVRNSQVTAAPTNSSLSAGGEGRGEVGSADSPFALRPSQSLLLEKIPFFVLAAVMSIVTLLIQGQTGVVKTMTAYPPGARLENLLVAYARYLGKIFWPENLAVYYSHPGYWPLWQALLAGVILCGLSVWLVAKARRYPFLLMGWLWFLVTLIPVIGLVQVGRQSMADRYSYLPSLGILILTVWGIYALAMFFGADAGKVAATPRRSPNPPTVPAAAPPLCELFQRHRIILAVLAIAAVAASAVLTRRQIAYWQNDETLFRHTLAVTQNNYFAHKALGTVLLSRNQTDEAIREFQAAIRLEPEDAEAHNNLGIILLNQGQVVGAAREFELAIRYKPDNAEARYNLGNILLNEGRMDEAIRQFQEALRFQPENAGARNDLGVALESVGRRNEAVKQFQEALRLKPEDTEIRTNLARALERKNAPAGR
jgi:Flp pilus assembly protein TadD